MWSQPCHRGDPRRWLGRHISRALVASLPQLRKLMHRRLRHPVQRSVGGVDLQPCIKVGIDLCSHRQSLRNLPSYQLEIGVRWGVRSYRGKIN